MTAAPQKVYVVPSVWMRARDPELPEPYQRVVGIDTAEGPYWSPYVSPGDRNASYQKSDAEAISLNLPSTQFARIHRFMQTEMDALIVPGFNVSRAFNCHSFARFVAAPVLRNSIREPWFPIRFGTYNKKPNLPSGKRAMVGWREPCVRATHSVIGLGEDVDSCLSVMAYLGYIGIASYDSVLARYAVRSEPTAGLYRW